MTKLEQLYEGKAKKVFKTDDENLYIVSYKDDATAFNGEKKGQIKGKGVINNQVTNYLMKYLSDNGIPTHFVEELSPTDSLVKKVTIIPLEVIIRNRVAGSLSKRVGVKEGTKIKQPILEYSYKDDSLGDPMVNDYHILALGYATQEELDIISSMAFKINDLLIKFFDNIGIILIDFKLEFGKDTDGNIILADEISPDTCRFWDKETEQKLDKDRFRRDLGNVEEAYNEILSRIFGDK